MNFLKVHKTQLPIFILALFFFAIVCVSEYYSNKTVCYTGESNTASVNFCRYQNYDEFLNNKSNDIIIFDDIAEMKQEKRNNPKLTFISGNLKIENGIYDINCDSDKKLKFLNNGKEVSSVTFMMPQDSERQISETEIPFYFYDYNNSNINRVDVTVDNKIVSALKMKANYI